MKQGRASHSNSGSTKVEPRSHAVSPAYGDSLGQMKGNHSTDSGTINMKSTPMYIGRGLEAPMKGTTVHHKGSQGQH